MPGIAAGLAFIGGLGQAPEGGVGALGALGTPGAVGGITVVADEPLIWALGPQAASKPNNTNTKHFFMIGPPSG